MLTAKYALVTGASSGLGKALCYELAKQQIPLILTARNQEALQKVAQELSVETEIVCADLSLSEDRKRLITLIEKKQPDLIINNAGFGIYGPVLDHPLSEWQQMVETNLQAVMQICIESARIWNQFGKKGTLVNISSAAAFFSYPHFCIYAATKAFLNRFSEGLDLELAADGIRVLTICPGQIDTLFRAKASANFPQKKDHITMPSDKAAQLILKKIESGKRLSIIDWRYACLIKLARILPKRWIQSVLKNSLKNRYCSKSLSLK